MRSRLINVTIRVSFFHKTLAYCNSILDERRLNFHLHTSTAGGGATAIQKNVTQNLNLVAFLRELMTKIVSSEEQITD